MEEKEIHDELVSIRNLMERSSKFISLSGLSGILAGIYALVGVATTYYFIREAVPDYSIIVNNDKWEGIFNNGDYVGFSFGIYCTNLIPKLLLTAIIVLSTSLITGIILTRCKAKRKGQPIWSKTSKSLLFYMATPLVAGGLLILIFLVQHHYGIVAPAMLIFYGFALVSASNFTFTDVKYLGLCEIALGLTAACLPGYGLLFWALGFGVLHIIYGSMMYLKYDR